MHRTLDPARYSFLPNIRALYSPWLEKILRDPHHLLLVAEASDDSGPTQLVGFLISVLEDEIPIYEVQQYGYIHDLWVEEAYRHQGIARLMVERTIEHYHQQGVTQIRLSTVSTNESARRLYSACGFRISTVDMLIELNQPRKHPRDGGASNQLTCRRSELA